MEIKNVRFLNFRNKTGQIGQNFQFFKGPFLRNDWPYGYDFWRIFRDFIENEVA